MKNTSFSLVLACILSLTIAQAAVPNPLIDAVRSGDVSTTESLIDILPGCNRIDTLNEILATEGGMSLLHLAVLNGHVDVTRLLLRRGADPVAEDSRGQTPRSIAQGNPELEHILSTAAKAKWFEQTREVVNLSDE